jgi:probable addiction module antidote protein
MASLKDPAEAAAYLNAVAADGDVRFMLKALRNVVEARGGVGALAKRAHMNRPSLYRALSNSGNPEVRTLVAILKFCGLKFMPAVAHG